MTIGVCPEPASEIHPREMVFKPHFYMCCRLTISPIVNSPEYVNGVLSSMRSWCEARALLSDILRIEGIEFVTFKYGFIHVRALPNFDLNQIKEKVVEAVDRYPASI